jgi:hypothetical protein
VLARALVVAVACVGLGVAAGAVAPASAGPSDNRASGPFDGSGALTENDSLGRP